MGKLTNYLISGHIQELRSSHYQSAEFPFQLWWGRWVHHFLVFLLWKKVMDSIPDRIKPQDGPNSGTGGSPATESQKIADEAPNFPEKHDPNYVIWLYLAGDQRLVVLTPSKQSDSIFNICQFNSIYISVEHFIQMTRGLSPDCRPISWANLRCFVDDHPQGSMW